MISRFAYLRSRRAGTLGSAIGCKEQPMKILTCLMLASLPLVASAAAQSPDESFYKDAAEGGLAEVEQGKLAEDKAQSQAVRDFGALMVHDHSAANEKLKTVAASKGMDLPTSPGISQMASIDKLKLLSGDTFDKSYVKAMLEDHEKDIAAFRREAADGKDPDARAFAAKTLPTLEVHLKKIRSIASSAGIATK
jgi:putative membrane protein